MKISILIKFIIVVAVLSSMSCSNSNRTDNNGRISDDNKFVFKGVMHNGTGLELSVHYPSQGFDKRYKSKIVDSIFCITYPKRENDIIILRVEESIRDNHASVWVPSFIAEDTIIFKCTMDSLLGRFLVPKDTKVIKGDLSKEYRKKQKEFFTYYGTNRKGLDSLDKKQRILKGYGNLYYKEPGSFHSVYGLYYLLYESRIPISDFSLEQRELIKSYFSNLDKRFQGNYYYNLVRQKIFAPTVQIGDVLGNFQLENFKGDEVNLKSFTTGKNLIMLEFWHSYCGLCRTFNKSFKNEYEEYVEYGLEIVSINTDENRENWIRSSQNDSISWVNLYAGKDSEIENYFEILEYPTRAIYDEELKLIKFGRIGEKELVQIFERNLHAGNR